MDSRHSQPPPHFSRFPDRPTISHPTQPPSAPPSHPPFFPPSSISQPMQIPFSDPFRSRPADPFLPSPHSQRRGSYGLPSSRDAPQLSASGLGSRESSSPAWPTTSGPSSNIPHSLHASPSRRHPLPNIPTSSSNSSYGYDPARRNSIGSNNSPQFFGTSSHEQSSLNFAPRQMPPPSPSQQPSSLSAYGSQRGPPPPPPPPSYSSRELPSLGTTSRQGTGMSISSLLGSDAPPPPPRSQQNSVPPPPTAVPMRPPSPRTIQSSGSRADRSPWARPETPEQLNPSHTSMRGTETLNYPSNSSPHYYAPETRESPEFSRNPATAPPPPPPYHSHPTPPRSHIFHPSPRDSYEARPSDDRMPPRPSSQPAPYALHPHNIEYQDGPGPQRASAFGSNGMQRNASQDGMSGPSPPHSERSGIVAQIERPVSSQPVGASSYQVGSRAPEEHNLLRRNLLGQEPIRDESRREYGSSNREEYSGPPRTGFRGQYYSQSPTSFPINEAPRSHPHIFDPLRRPADQLPPESIQGPSRPPFDYERRVDSVPGRPDSRTGDPMIRQQGGELMQQSRSFLGISSDPNKRGRASPLPQAVKGAQAQLVAPGSDPSIKSEFGKLFPGLGSGLGGPGSLTPSRQSPVPQRIRDDLQMGDNDGIKMARVGSRGPRGRRSGEEETEQGRITPLGSGGRGGRRKQPMAQTQSQRQVDDESPTSGRLFSSATPAHLLDDVAPRQMAPPPPIIKPLIKVSSESVLKRASNKERHHLGSALYDVRFTNPPFASTPMMDKWGYCMQYKAARRFRWEDENCTFTVRVPREYLSDKMREKLCTDRYLFGTEIFTEDSDPILAAIHSGWLRGAWPADVDTSLMDLPPAPAEDEPVALELTQPPPAGPVLTPMNMDCHIMLLILPPLVQYSSSLRFGVKSRSWGDNHDGLSFMVIGIRWIDEGLNRMVERTGKGRRGKLAMDIASNAIDTPRSKKRRLNGFVEENGIDALGSKPVRATTA